MMGNITIEKRERKRKNTVEEGTTEAVVAY